jgi:hypothetical protein
MDGWMDGWMDRRTDDVGEWILFVLYDQHFQLINLTSLITWLTIAGIKFAP